MFQELARAKRAGRFGSISQGTQANVAFRRLCGSKRSADLAAASSVEPATTQSLKLDEPASSKIDGGYQEHPA